MKRTALILAGAAVFDLGTITVAAQAQQVTQQPLVRPSTNVAVAPGRAPPPSTAPAVTADGTDLYMKFGRAAFVKIDIVNTVRACTARRGEVVVHEGVQQCRIAEDPNRAMGEVSTTR